MAFPAAKPMEDFMKKTIAALLLLLTCGCVPSYWPYGHENPNEKKGAPREERERRDERKERDAEHRNGPDEEREQKGYR